jgi:hypothetical protein
MPFLNFEPNNLRVAAGAILRGVSGIRQSHLIPMAESDTRYDELFERINLAEDDLAWKWPQWKSENRIKFREEDVGGPELRQERALIAGYLHNDTMQLHPRRTLDQFYYHMLGEEELERRDQDQVIFRWMAKLKAQAEEEQQARSAQGKQPRIEGKKMNFDPKVLMVDQLWLWVIDESECLPSVFLEAVNTSSDVLVWEIKLIVTA